MATAYLSPLAQLMASPVWCQAIACRVGVNLISIPETGIGIRIETGGIEKWNQKCWNWNWKLCKWNQNFTTITAALTRTRTRIVFHGTNSSCKRYACVSFETWSLPPVVWWQKPLFPFEWTGGLKMVTLNISLSSFSQSDIRPYLFGVVTFVLFAVATPNKYGDLLFESRVTSRRLREWAAIFVLPSVCRCDLIIDANKIWWLYRSALVEVI